MTFVLSTLRKSPAYAELATRCRVHSVLFSPISELKIGGSGTLVRFKNFCGILTATHVIANHIESRQIFAPMQKTEDAKTFFNVSIPLLNILYLETPQGIKALQGSVPGQRTYWHPGTLDICLLQIDSKLFEDLLLNSGKQAVDLLKHKADYIKNRDLYTLANEQYTPWIWAIDGSPREDAEHDKNRILQSRYDGLYVCVGSKQGTYKTDPLTLVKTPFDQDADRIQHDLGPTIDDIPFAFAGISGGGMHQVSFDGKNGPETISNALFSGVCVAEIQGECLYSRGPSALYDIFVTYLDTL